MINGVDKRSIENFIEYSLPDCLDQEHIKEFYKPFYESVDIMPNNKVKLGKTIRFKDSNEKIVDAIDQEIFLWCFNKIDQKEGAMSAQQQMTSRSQNG